MKKFCFHYRWISARLVMGYCILKGEPEILLTLSVKKMDRQWVACYACMCKYCAVFKKAFPSQWCPETKEKQTETPRQESKAPSAAVSCQTEAQRNAAANNEYGVKPAKKRRKGRKTQVFWYSLKTRSPLAKRDISISMYIKPTNRGIYSGHSVPLGGFFLA